MKATGWCRMPTVAGIKAVIDTVELHRHAISSWLRRCRISREIKMLMASNTSWHRRAAHDGADATRVVRYRSCLFVAERRNYLKSRSSPLRPALAADIAMNLSLRLPSIASLLRKKQNQPNNDICRQRTPHILAVAWRETINRLAIWHLHAAE